MKCFAFKSIYRFKFSNGGLGHGDSSPTVPILATAVDYDYLSSHALAYLDRFPSTPVLDLVDYMVRCRPSNISEADFKSSIDILRGIESSERLRSAQQLQLLCSAAGSAVDCFIPAVAQLITAATVKQNRPVRSVPDDEIGRAHV